MKKLKNAFWLWGSRGHCSVKSNWLERCKRSCSPWVDNLS